MHKPKVSHPLKGHNFQTNENRKPQNINQGMMALTHKVRTARDDAIQCIQSRVAAMDTSEHGTNQDLVPYAEAASRKKSHA